MVHRVTSALTTRGVFTPVAQGSAPLTVQIWRSAICSCVNRDFRVSYCQGIYPDIFHVTAKTSYRLCKALKSKWYDVENRPAGLYGRPLPARVEHHLQIAPVTSHPDPHRGIVVDSLAHRKHVTTRCTRPRRHASRRHWDKCTGPTINVRYLKQFPPLGGLEHSV